MGTVLASHSCYCRNFPFISGAFENRSFSSSVKAPNFVTTKKHERNCPKPYKFCRLEVEAQQTESPQKVGRNGRPIIMVPTTEIFKINLATMEKTAEVCKPEQQIVNVNGLVKREARSAIVKASKFREVEEFPPIEENFSWANENYNSFQRSIDVWSFVLSLSARLSFDNTKWTYLGGFSEEKKINRRRKTASWLRERLLQLGPTFIKIGQLSSTRSDLFPPEFLEELAKLQDMVPAFSPKKARALIESELGAPVDVLFKVFEDRPIAAASLGQVHRAILHNGEKVVVKVQRPGLKKLFEIDLRNLKLIAEYIQTSGFFGGPVRDWIGIYEECAKIMDEEMDYINEGKNADRLRRDFRNIKWVRVPLVYWDYTASRVLTLEYVPGIKIDRVDMLDAQGFSRSRIASRTTEAYLIQILKTGFFHADPHPGNLAIDVDESLIYYDFGMMAEIKSYTRDRLLNLFYAVYTKEAKKVIQSLIELEALEPNGDISSVRRSVQFFLDSTLNESQDQEPNYDAVRQDLLAMAADQEWKLPTSVTIVLKAFTTIEGIGQTLNPKFSFVKIAGSYIQELLNNKNRQHPGTQLVEEIRKQADNARSYTMSMPYRVRRIEEFVKKLDSGDVKLQVRVLESERAAQKATLLQMATMYTVVWGTLLNLGVTLTNQGSRAISNGLFVAAGIFLILLARSLKNVKRLDKIEKMI